jgi:Mg/Co/Ni transporter MgtE
VTGVTLGLICAGVIGLMVFAAWLAELAGPNPLVLDERRHAHLPADKRRHDRELAGVVVGIMAVVFVAALVIPQGTPA